MGWKTLKDHFGIQGIVQVCEKGICIGSGYIHDLAVVNPDTGVVTENSTFSSYLKEVYPLLQKASAEEVLQVLNTPDVFQVSIAVFTYHGGDIIEKQCEVTGYPNITHDGCLMYENTYDTNKQKIAQRAKQNAQLGVKYTRKAVAEAEKELARKRCELVVAENELAKLNCDYPE
jgi:hypothetical protein